MRNYKVQNLNLLTRRRRAARNPVKSLLAREDLVEHLEDLRYSESPAKKVGTILKLPLLC